MTALLYIGAALAEIAGCFAFWAWLRLGKSVLWLIPGIASLILRLATDARGQRCGGPRLRRLWWGLYLRVAAVAVERGGGAPRSLGRGRRRSMPDRRQRHPAGASNRLIHILRRTLEYLCLSATFPIRPIYPRSTPLSSGTDRRWAWDRTSTPRAYCCCMALSGNDPFPALR